MLYIHNGCDKNVVKNVVKEMAPLSAKVHACSSCSAISGRFTDMPTLTNLP